MPEDTPPGRVGRFEIRRELGRGTMGVVFLAHDPTLHRTVALKVIRLSFATNARERDDFERRFLTEARAAASLSHPGIVVVHEAGRDAESGMLYLALEHLEGHVLSERLAEGGRIAESEALRLGAQIARALDYAHRKGVVHRDVKPANVMVLPDGQAKLLDFGLAKLEAGLDQTAAGQFMGTPFFVSPEQALGLPVDGRADLFSLGAILYTALSGRRPFEGETLARILSRVAHQPPRPLREANPAVSAASEGVIQRLLAKDPNDRYATGAALAEDLEDILAGRPPGPAARPFERGGASGPAAGVSAGDGTVVAQRPTRGPSDERGLPELLIDEASPTALPPPPARRRRRSPLRAASLTLLLGGLAFFYSAMSGPERLGQALAPFLVAPARIRSPDRPPTPAASPRPADGASAAADHAPAETAPAAVAPSPADEGAGDAPTGASPAPPGLLVPASPEAPPATLAAAAEAPPDTGSEADEETPVLLPDEGLDEAAEAPTAKGPDGAVGAEALPAATPAPAPTPLAGAATLPRASPSVPPSPGPRKSPLRPSPSPKSALAIHLEHPLSRGTVRVWLNDKLVLRASLGSTVSKKFLFFTFRSGHVRETLEVPPGRHRVRVEVRGKDRSDSAQATAEFKAKVRRRLYVREGGSRGRLAFEWR